MNFVGCTILQYNIKDSTLQIAGNNARCPQNGFAYVFLSNETQNVMVYFDDFKVTHTRSAIVEENHYLPFGLKIAAISSRKLGNIDNGNLNNNYCYQGIYAEVDDEIGWNEFELRNYDPQIGRWTSVDPKDEFFSPYIGMGNNPIVNVDPDGGNTWGTIGTIIGAAGGAVAAKAIIDNNQKHSFFRSGVGKALTYAVLGIAGGIIGGGIGHSAQAAQSDKTNKQSFFGNLDAYWHGIKGDPKTHVNWITPGDDYQAIAIPKFWGKFKFNLNISWVQDSKLANRFTEIASFRLSSIISGYTLGFPNYNGNITLPANNGNLSLGVSIYPAFVIPNFNGGTISIVPGTNNTSAIVNIDYLDIPALSIPQGPFVNRDMFEMSKSNAINNNNNQLVKVFEIQIQPKKWKYLKIGNRSFPKIRTRPRF